MVYISRKISRPRGATRHKLTSPPPKTSLNHKIFAWVIGLGLSAALLVTVWLKFAQHLPATAKPAATAISTSETIARTQPKTVLPNHKQHTVTKENKEPENLDADNVTNVSNQATATVTSESTQQQTKENIKKVKKTHRSKAKDLYDYTTPGKFDFYTMLTQIDNNLDIEPTDSHNTTIADPRPLPDLSLNKSTTINDTKQKYVIQVGSFKNINDANALRAQLTLQGYVAAISNTHLSNGDLWYRVTIGPINTYNQANVLQKQLEQEQYDSTMILKSN